MNILPLLPILVYMPVLTLVGTAILAFAVAVFARVKPTRDLSVSRPAAAPAAPAAPARLVLIQDDRRQVAAQIAA